MIFNKIFNQNFKVEFSYVDATNIENIKNTIKDKTTLIWLETPTNPLMKLCDIQTIAEIAKKKKIIVNKITVNII